MGNISTLKELKDEIQVLEFRQTQEELILKASFNEVFESIKPNNLLKNTFKELVTAPDFKDDLLNTSLGLASGFLSKKVVIGSTINPVKQILGSFLQMGVTGIVSRNAEGIRSKLMSVLGVMFQNKSNQEN